MDRARLDDRVFKISDYRDLEEATQMTIDEKDIRDEGVEDYKRIKNFLRRDYSLLARRADIITEECLRQCSRGADGVMKWQTYPVIYGVVFKDLLDVEDRTVKP